MMTKNQTERTASGSASSPSGLTAQREEPTAQRGERTPARETMRKHKTFHEKMTQAKADKKAHFALLETGEELKGVAWTEYWKVTAQRDELLAAFNKILRLLRDGSPITHESGKRNYMIDVAMAAIANVEGEK